MEKRKKLFKHILLSILGAAALTLIVLFSMYMLWEKAPEVEPAAPSTKPLTGEEDPKESEDTAPDEGMPFATARQDGVYTILLVGNDDGTGNTDTMMVAKVDTVQHKIDVVSIPRDTIINVDWSVRKLNSVYWGSKNSGGNGIDALNMHIKKLIGFDVDCYAVLDLGVFIDVVDALGGLDFDVPVPMHYTDAGQNLYIDLEPGMQHLDGYQAMGVCRFRSGYANGDYGRIEMQQRFLKSCVEQFIKLGNIPNVSKVIKILSDGLDTNLTGANIAFFLRQALLCEIENINFHTVPSNPDMIGGLSYSVIDLWRWLPMLNEVLNPYAAEIGYENVDIVYKDGDFTATKELKGDWYYTWQPEDDEEADKEPEETAPPQPTEPPETENPQETEPSPELPPEEGGETPESPQEGEGAQDDTRPPEEQGVFA